MAIKTSTFGGVLLTEDAAKAFEKQFIKNPLKNNKLASLLRKPITQSFLIHRYQLLKLKN